MYQRRKTRVVPVGSIALGGDNPIAVQTMTKAGAGDVEEALRQIHSCADHGCQLIRCAVPNPKAVSPFEEVCRRSPLPVVADIHFSCELAVAALKAGAAKIRINPGNMEDWDQLRKVAETAANTGAAIRIGVNSGSIQHKSPDDDRSIAEALTEEALVYASRFEDFGFANLVLSLKSPDPLETIAINRTVAAACDYPLHLGVTHAGPEDTALLKSAIGIGGLLAEGIGDTIRLSFTAPPLREVLAGQELLRAAGLLRDRPNLISCPTCGRCHHDLTPMVEQVRRRIASIQTPLTVAVMGCEVNGPGEATQADLGIAMASQHATLFIAGKPVKRVPLEEAAEALVAAIHDLEGTPS